MRNLRRLALRTHSMMLEIVTKRADALRERGVDPDTGILRTADAAKDVAAESKVITRFSSGYVGQVEDWSEVAQPCFGGVTIDQSWEKIAEAKAEAFHRRKDSPRSPEFPEYDPHRLP